jgi:hypothetical protein
MLIPARIQIDVNINWPALEKALAAMLAASALGGCGIQQMAPAVAVVQEATKAAPAEFKTEAPEMFPVGKPDVAPATPTLRGTLPAEETPRKPGRPKKAAAPLETPLPTADFPPVAQPAPIPADLLPPAPAPLGTAPIEAAPSIQASVPAAPTVAAADITGLFGVPAAALAAPYTTADRKALLAAIMALVATPLTEGGGREAWAGLRVRAYAAAALPGDPVQFNPATATDAQCRAIETQIRTECPRAFA